MPVRTRLVAVLAVALLAAAGCGPGKLNKEVSFEVSDTAAKAWGFDPQAADQTIKLEVTSDQPVDVFILAGTDENTALTMDSKELEQKAAGFKRDATKDTVTGKVPAKQAAAVVVRIGQKRMPATGKIKISN